MSVKRGGKVNVKCIKCNDSGRNLILSFGEYRSFACSCRYKNPENPVDNRKRHGRVEKVKEVVDSNLTGS